VAQHLSSLCVGNLPTFRESLVSGIALIATYFVNQRGNNHYHQPSFQNA
jgi:hypothetical protein